MAFFHSRLKLSPYGRIHWDLAAIGDDKVTEQFADISRQEYMAVGIRQALHPQVDLATEPRWPRISGTFGEDASTIIPYGYCLYQRLPGRKTRTQ